MLVVSALYVDIDAREAVYAPTLTGFVDFEAFPEWVSIICSLVSLIIVSSSLYYLNERFLAVGKRVTMLPALYLVIALISPQTIYFSGSTIASFWLVWSLYHSLNSSKSETSLFLTSFFVSISAIFEPLFIWLLPIPLIFSFSGRVFNMRDFVMVLIAAILPFVFLFSGRYLLFDDASLYGHFYIDKLAKVGTDFTLEIKIVDYVLFGTMGILLLLALREVFSKLFNYKITKSKGFNRTLAVLIFCLAVMLFYPGIRSFFGAVIALPLSILFAELISVDRRGVMGRIVFLIFLILIVLSRISDFL